MAKRVLKDGAEEVSHCDLDLGNLEGHFGLLRGGTTDKLVLWDWKRQMYEEIYFLGIHLGKRD